MIKITRREVKLIQPRYVTTDNCEFFNAEQAQIHQNNLDVRDAIAAFVVNTWHIQKPGRYTFSSYDDDSYHEQCNQRDKIIEFLTDNQTAVHKFFLALQEARKTVDL